MPRETNDEKEQQCRTSNMTSKTTEGYYESIDKETTKISIYRCTHQMVLRRTNYRLDPYLVYRCVSS